MYIPPDFKIDDPEKIRAFIRTNSFATLITHGTGGLIATHLPLLIDDASTTIIGHVARANPHWRDLAGTVEALAIFHGPHAYVSPRWYATAPAVPTWNYAAVHVYGMPQLIEDEARLVDVVERTTRFYEGDTPLQIPDTYRDRLLKGIVGFEIAITSIEAKFKLGQNRSKEDRNGVAAALSSSKNPMDQELARFMRSEGVADPE